MRKLNGWLRLGIALPLVWLIVLGVECWIEKIRGPFGSGWLTDTVISKTGEPIELMKDSMYRDLVPVRQAVSWERLSIVFVAPVILLWAVGLSVAWVVQGFKSGRENK